MKIVYIKSGYKLTFSPKMKLIRTRVSEEYADKQTNRHTNKQTGYQYYNIDNNKINKIVKYNKG